MFLRRLRLENIRSIRALDIGFESGREGRAWTYILGENGTGKTSVLKCIALVMAGGDAVSELAGRPDEWITLGEDHARIQVDFATADGEQRGASLAFRRGEGTFEFVANNQTALRDLDAAIRKAERNYFVVGYGVSRRARTDEFASLGIASPYRAPRSQLVGTLFSAEASLIPLERWAMDLDYRQGAAGMEIVKDAFRTLLPDVDFKAIDRDGRRLIFSTPDGDLPLTALSDGYQAMAAWCGDLLFRITENFASRREPLKTRGVLLVDELDLHLHPVWQRRLVSFLKQTLPNMQAVVTTHSPLTVHQAGPEELYILERRDNGVQAEAFPGAPNKMLLPQLLESPVFGLKTLESPQVTEALDELSWLQTGTDVENPASTDSKRVRVLERELAGVPKWREAAPYMARTNALLEKIARRLGDPGDPDPVSSLVSRDDAETRHRRNRS